jgi:hypothetical protein
MTGFRVLPNMLEFDVRYAKGKSEGGNAPAKHDKTAPQVAFNCYGGKHNLKRRADDTLNEDQLIDNDDQIARLSCSTIFEV